MALFSFIDTVLPLINLLFFILGVPFVLWLNNKTRNDWICLFLGIAYMIVYGIIVQPEIDDWIFFFFGLSIGYITDYWGVSSKKWKYHPWDPKFGYSYYVGFSWGMISIFTYNISTALPVYPSLFWLPGILFMVPMVVLEWKYGETRRTQYFLFARAFFTFLAFAISNNLALLFIGCFVGSYIEFTGVEWIKNWLYIDSMSYIFISFGYSLILLFSKLLLDILNQNPIDILVVIFFLSAIAAFAIDTFWAQKFVPVDQTKARRAAEEYYSRR
ncbi:MAG: hypothetical protein ACFFE8_06080 [Candidatus Heimdallarchaeota archaeon]